MVYSQSTDKEGKPIHRYLLGVLPFTKQKGEKINKMMFDEIMVKLPNPVYLFLGKAA